MNIAIAAIVALVIIIGAFYESGWQMPDSIVHMPFNMSKGYRIAWCFSLWAIAFLTTPSIVGLVGNWTMFLAFFTCAGLVLMGALPVVEDKDDVGMKIYNIVAIVTAVSSQAMIALNCPVALIIWLPLVALSFKQKPDHLLSWIYILCTIDIFVFWLLKG